MNDDLIALHRHLIGVVDALAAALGRATSHAERIAILGEIDEVNARVALLGRQLFTQQTAAVRHAADGVAAALPELDEAIRRSNELKIFVTGVTRFLKLVDAVIDLAKLVV